MTSSQTGSGATGLADGSWELRLPVGEVLRAAGLGGLCADDERGPYGGVLLECDGQVRRWSAGSETLAVRVEGGPTSCTGRVVLPRRVLPVAQAVAGTDGEVHLVVHELDGVPSRVTVAGSDGRVSVPLPSQASPLHARFVQHEEEGSDADHAEAMIDASALRRMVQMLRVAPVALTPGPSPETVMGPVPSLTLDEGTVRLEVTWDGVGDFEYELAGVGHGTARCFVHPADLDRALHGRDGEVLLRVPLGSGGFVSLVDITNRGMDVALITPVPDPTTVMVASLAMALRSVYGDAVDEEVGAEGDRSFTVRHDGAAVHIEVRDTDLLLLRLRAVALEGVSGTKALMKELNELTLRLELVRVGWIDRRVEAVADLALDVCDGDVVIAAIERVLAVACEIAPVVQAVHGGTIPVEADLAGD